jgi:ribonuclease HI
MHTVYTDGSCKDSIGGYAVVTNDIQYYGLVPFKICTNNKAELYAIKKALKIFNGDIIIYSDSMYSINSLTIWYKKWEKNGFIGSNKKSIKNKKLIISIHELMKNRNVELKYIKAHNGHKMNELADKLANKGRLS